MMEYMDFYDIAEYGNEVWRGKFQPREIAKNAYDYFEEFKESMQKPRVTPTIQNLLELLDEDGSETALEFANNIRYELNLLTVEK